MDQAVSSQRSQVSELTTIEHQDLPSSHKQVEVDWYAVHEPTLPRQLEIRQLYQLAGNSVVCCVSFSQDRDKLATGCNGLARIFEIETGRELSTLMHREIEGRQGPGHVRAVCFSPDGGSLCTGAEDGVIRVWNAIEGVLQNTLEGHAREILSLAFTTDGRILASGSVDQTVRLWDMSDTRQISTMDIGGSVASVSVSPNDHMIAIGTLEGSITIRTLPNGDLLRVIQQPRGAVNGVFSVAFSPSGRYLAWSCKDKTVNTWNVDIENAPPTSQATPSDVGGETVQRVLSGHTDHVLSTCWTMDEEWIMSGSKDCRVIFWHRDARYAYVVLKGHTNSVISVTSQGPDGLFATASGDKKAILWRYQKFPHD